MVDEHILRPSNLDIKALHKSQRTSPDQFGQQYNADSDASKWSNESPQDSRRYHSRADTDVGPRSLHHTLGPRHSQASPGDHTHDGSTSKRIVQRGRVSISFTTLDLYTQVITFDNSFPSGVVPVVMTNINSAAGATIRWGSRAYTISNTGFTLYVFKGDAADPSQTWANIEVQWMATN